MHILKINLLSGTAQIVGGRLFKPEPRQQVKTGWNSLTREEIVCARTAFRFACKI